MSRLGSRKQKALSTVLLRERAKNRKLHKTSENELLAAVATLRWAIPWGISQSCQGGENAGKLKHRLSIAHYASYQLAQLISCFLTSTSYPW